MTEGGVGVFVGIFGQILFLDRHNASYFENGVQKHYDAFAEDGSCGVYSGFAGSCR